jgi:hypothetical protein
VSGHPFNAAKPNTSGQASSLSATPSPSVSGQPFNAAKPNTSGQASALSWIPSPSVSGQPLNSFKPATSGHHLYHIFHHRQYLFLQI